ncbi:hypothetical protein C8F04DRAFT_449101 [Mycena alexandri]|uniref:GRF-type domain-containing protein n=1 Tax=Mycena alexandri TaxID=1745969 RepID=A0AAD6XHV0_9AGAR|nr:hypothetical protein C8F04DRAFT_449101 [Mycena alexandri]
MSNVYIASPVRRNGEVRCFRHSGTVLERKLSQTKENPNRAFYCCNGLVSDGEDGMEQCGFFKWEDELPMPSPQSSQAPNISQSTPVTPSKRPAATSASVHTLSPAQKRLNTSSQTPTRSPASQARLDAILRAAQDSPASKASTSASAIASSSALRASVPASPSSSNTATSQTPQTPQIPPAVPSSFSAQPSATSFRPLTPPPTAERTERHWPPQTPPNRRPIEQSEDVGRTRNENSNGPRNGIRNSVLGASGVRDGGVLSPICRVYVKLKARCQEVRLDDPFIFPSGSATDSGDSEPRGPVASSSLAESESADAEEPSAADELGSMASRLAQFPEYISRLERRLTAAEKSNNAKAQKMERMQEEIDSLKAQNAELQRSLAQRP